MNIPIHIITAEILPFLGRDIVTCYRCMRVCKEIYKFLRECTLPLSYDDLVNLYLSTDSNIEKTDRYLSRIIETKSLKFVDKHVAHFIEILHLRRSGCVFPNRSLFLDNTKSIIKDHVIEYMFNNNQYEEYLHKILSLYDREETHHNIPHILFSRGISISPSVCLHLYKFWANYIGVMIMTNSSLDRFLSVLEIPDIVFNILKVTLSIEKYFYDLPYLCIKCWKCDGISKIISVCSYEIKEKIRNILYHNMNSFNHNVSFYILMDTLR